ncbi:MAG: ECF RNA polymerase sigma factor SigK [Nitriliruptoraceae bacterium]
MARVPPSAITLEVAPRPDADLMLAVAKGDKAAFSEVYDRFAGKVYGIVKRVVRDPAQSEEIAQEVLVEIWRTAARFDPERGSVQGWMLTTAHRRAIDHVRSEQAHRDRNQRVGVRDHFAVSHDETAETAEINFEHAQVREALNALSDLQRQAIELAYYQGYTYPEVAEILGAPVGTVKTRIRDGFIRLRDELGVTQ